MFVYFLFACCRIAAATLLGDYVPNIRFLLAWPPPYIKNTAWLRIRNTVYKKLTLNILLSIVGVKFKSAYAYI